MPAMAARPQSEVTQGDGSATAAPSPWRAARSGLRAVGVGVLDLGVLDALLEHSRLGHPKSASNRRPTTSCSTPYNGDSTPPSTWHRDQQSTLTRSAPNSTDSAAASCCAARTSDSWPSSVDTACVPPTAEAEEEAEDLLTPSAAPSEQPPDRLSAACRQSPPSGTSPRTARSAAPPSGRQLRHGPHQLRRTDVDRGLAAAGGGAAGLSRPRQRHAGTRQGQPRPAGPGNGGRSR